MRILSAEQHRALDRATIARDQIDSLSLMERAATAFTDRFVHYYPRNRHAAVTIVCGPGNNGGDGLVAARLLRLLKYRVRVLLCRISGYSPDNLQNQRRAKDVGVSIQEIKEGEEMPLGHSDAGTVLIDAFFGTGLSRPVTGYWAQLIDHLNTGETVRVSIDLPSGMYADRASEGTIFRAHRTLSLGYPKLALFSPSNTEFLGDWELIDFPLDDAFTESLPEAAEENFLLGRDDLSHHLKVRHANDHKGTFGHALLIAGSYGKMGAAIISARAILRAGAGMVTVHLPQVGYQIMQISFPEAMCEVDEHKYHFTGNGNLDKYRSIGVGPGLGTDPSTQKALAELLRRSEVPMVIDADALNTLAQHPELLGKVPKGSILTPHPKEFERLFGTTENDFSRWQLQRERAKSLGLVILLKTGYTAIALPDGSLHFNRNGNPGMGTAGTGDALTGILTGLLAQGYAPEVAAKLGVYLHGLSGDIAAEELEQESLLAEDVVSHLGKAFRRLRHC